MTNEQMGLVVAIIGIAETTIIAGGTLLWFVTRQAGAGGGLLEMVKQIGASTGRIESTQGRQGAAITQLQIDVAVMKGEARGERRAESRSGAMDSDPPGA